MHFPIFTQLCFCTEITPFSVPLCSIHTFTLVHMYVLIFFSFGITPKPLGQINCFLLENHLKWYLCCWYNIYPLILYEFNYCPVGISSCGVTHNLRMIWSMGFGDSILRFKIGPHRFLTSYVGHLHINFFIFKAVLLEYALQDQTKVIVHVQVQC